ncbi:MAG TPA: hypothetical protein VD968_13105 [Pyrinomonadaceae bacterium]|nr:hypothetical protein [Pyrinomonadaceae bacterium]
MKRTVVAVGGFSSDSGKTTLVCELLRALPGWEAVKVSRGHYRSCGRDPQACCVSPLLGEEPTVRSGRAETYAAGKDTGRYWDAGASNVHWAIVTDRQVGAGVALALGRVSAPGVVVEGNSFLRHVEADYTVMVVRPDALKVKPTARRALRSASSFYLSDDGRGISAEAWEAFERWRREQGEALRRLPVYTRESLPELVGQIRAASLRSAPAAGGL